jgi:hypothetical protein
MPTGPSQAMNLGGSPSPYGDSFISLDLMKGADAWFYFRGNKPVDVPKSALKTDANGWLTELPVINGKSQAVYTNVVYTQQLEPGQYILEWDGKGKLGVYQDARMIGPNKMLIDYKADYIADDGSPTDDGFTVRIEATDPNDTGNYVRNIRLYNAEDADLVRAGEIFDPKWMDQIDDFRILRTHGWQNTNFQNVRDWSPRQESADKAVWAPEGRGMPFELLVDIANETRSDLWLNIPHTASDAYMRKAAAYVKANLDSDLRVYAEFSNEYFTTIFDQYKYFQQGGEKAFGNAPDAAAQFYGVRSARMAEIFTKVFGEEADRLRPVVTVDNVAFLDREAQRVLTAPAHVADGGRPPVKSNIDVIATDGYLLWEAGTKYYSDLLDDWMTDADGGFGRARDFLISQLNDELLPSWQKGRALAEQYGLEFMVYEGGALLLNQPASGEPNPKYTDFALRFTKSPEMREVYEAMAAAWATVGTGPFAWFADVGRPGDYGDYGHWKGPDFIPDERTKAIIEANEMTEPWWKGDRRPESTFDDGLYAAGDAKANKMTGTLLADRLYGLAGNDDLQGLAARDRLWGGAGNDTLTGGGNADELHGGGGDDFFVFRTPRDGGDRILKFGSGGSAGDDAFRLSGEAFGDRDPGLLDPGQFQVSELSAAQTKDARIIYDSDDHRVFYDADGKGGQASVLLAIVQPDAVITASDFIFY